jgi:hypothetical protein
MFIFYQERFNQHLSILMVITKAVETDPSWVINSRSVNQNIPRLLFGIQHFITAWTAQSSLPHHSYPYKVKLSLCLTNYTLLHKRVWGSGCIGPRFLDLGTSWRWVVSFTLRSLYHRGKSPRYPLDRMLGGSQSRSGRRGEEKILDSTGTRTPTPQLSSL